MFKKLFSKSRQPDEVTQVFESLSQRLENQVRVSFIYVEFLALVQCTKLLEEMKDQCDDNTSQQIDSIQDATLSILNVFENLPALEEAKSNELTHVTLKTRKNKGDTILISFPSPPQTGPARAEAEGAAKG